MVFDKPNKHFDSDEHMHDKHCEDGPDRMHFGKMPLATLADVKHLHHEVIKWLMGPGKDFGYYGYVPFKEDGTIDPMYIDEKFVGVDVFNNAQLIDKNAKTLEFKGNVVKVFKDNGKVVVYIKDQAAYSHLGTVNGKSDSNLYLNEESQSRLTSMICPIGPDTRYFGYTPGEQIFGFIAANKHDDYIVFENKEPIYFKDNYNTKFVVSLLNARGEAIFTVESAKVKGNSTNIILGDNRYCSLQIFEFEKEDLDYKGKIRLKINLPLYIKNSSKFNVSITHYNGLLPEETTTWISPDYFYCTGEQIETDTLDITAYIDYDSDVQKKKVCGITYVTSGKVKFVITGINNINNGAVVPNKLKFESDITDEVYVFQDNDVNYQDDLPLSISANNVVWTKSFEIKKDLLYPLDKISAKVTLSNAFHTVEKVWTNVKVKNQMEQAYINTYNKYPVSNITYESFDGKVIPTPEFDYGVPAFSNLTKLLQSDYLQFVPNYGLIWPNVFDVENVNFNKRYYKRSFKGEDIDTSLIWGGTFVFGNLTKEEFFLDTLGIKLSINYGQTWFNLKEYKDGNDPLGILCDVKEFKGQLFVRFAFPEDMTSQHHELMLFELSMSYPNESRISYIKLRNEDNTKDF